MKFKNKIIILLLILLSLSISFGCAKPSYEKTDITYDREITPLTPEQIKEAGGFAENMEMVASSNNLNLYVNMLTAEFYVEDAINNNRWFSNPTGWKEDNISGVLLNESLGSQIIVEYYSERGRQGKLTSYADSFLRGQVDVQKIENGVRVDYLMGIMKVRQYCPRILRAEEFEKILDALPAEESRNLERRYRYVEVESLSGDSLKNLTDSFPKIVDYEKVYVIRSVNLEVEKQIGEQLENLGWTEEKTIDEHNLFGFISQEQNTGSFLIPVEYRLENDFFVAEVLTEQIQSRVGFYLHSIDVIPYFASAGSSDNGFMMIPDGSGALASLNSSTRYGYAYKQPVYGKDLAISQELNNQITEQIYMPVFGIKTEQGGVLAIIESGEASASIQCNIAGVVSSYNAVWSSFVPLPSDYMSYENLLDEDGINIFPKSMIKDRYRIRYYMLSNDASDYTDMAIKYRNYLKETGELESLQDNEISPFYMELNGAIEKRSTFMGIPYFSHAPLTTFNQAKQIIEQLIEYDVQEIKVRYTGWANNGLNNSLYKDSKPLAVLGGNSGLEELIDFAKSNNIPLYMDAEMSFVYKDNLFDGFLKNRDSARLMTKKLATKNDTLISTGKILQTGRYVLSVRSLENVMQDFLGGYGTYQNNYLSLASMGKYISADYRESQNIDRVTALSMIKDVLQKDNIDRYEILMDGGNAAVLRYASGVLNSPFDSSRFLIMSKSVPFYQIVLSGSLQYAGPALNLSGDWKKIILKSAETGAGLYCNWMYEENSELQNTNRSDLYALNYSTWFDDLVKSIVEYQSDMAGIAGKEIIYHSFMEDNVYKTVYDGGNVVYVNYGNQAATIEGVTIEAESYLVLKGGV